MYLLFRELMPGSLKLHSYKDPAMTTVNPDVHKRPKTRIGTVNMNSGNLGNMMMPTSN
jgi:hypothetical protein